MNDDADLRQRLAEAEATIEALRSQEVDAVIGSEQLMLLRLREAEQKLRESEERFRVLVESTAQAVWETDAQGQVVEESPTWLEYTGQQPTESLGDGFLNAFHPDDRESMRTKWREAVDSQSILDAESRLHGPGGTWRWTHVRAAPIRKAPDGPVAKWVGMNTDISQRKAAEILLQQARDRAEAATKARGEFLSNMSHEIRTPMTAILGYADILGDRLQDPDDRQCVETIRGNARFLLELINDMLDISKIDAGRMQVQKEDVSPARLAAEVFQLMKVRADEKQLALKVEFETSVPETLETDALRVRQILVNLLGNAIKFTEEGEVRLVIRFVPQRSQVEFDVIDTGIGIHQTEVKRLFEPFTQSDVSTTRVAGGTGLGLTISRRLARILGGDISVESIPGKGSTFTLAIDCGTHGPLQQAPPRLDLSLPANTQEADRPQLVGRILLVDDRRDVLFLAKRMIADAGGSMIAVSSAAEALELIGEDSPNEAEIDAVLMDMHMPVMDGVEATRKLRQRGFSRPIIALTAGAMQEDRDKCFAAGCDDFISKPIDRQVLIDKLSYWINRS